MTLQAGCVRVCPAVCKRLPVWALFSRYPWGPSQHLTASSVQAPRDFNKWRETEEVRHEDGWEGGKTGSLPQKLLPVRHTVHKDSEDRIGGHVWEVCLSSWYCSLGARVCKQILLLTLGFVRADRLRWGGGGWSKRQVVSASLRPCVCCWEYKDLTVLNENACFTRRVGIW